MNVRTPRAANVFFVSALASCLLVATDAPARADNCSKVSGISDPVITEGDLFNKSVTVYFTLDDPAVGGETITVVAFDVSARSPSDYVAKVQTFKFSKGNIYKTFKVAIKSDRVAEAQESFIVDAVASSGFTCGVTASAGVVTIIDNDH